MSIKDNIKEELIKKITKRQNAISKAHNEYMNIANETGEVTYYDGLIEQIEDEYNFLYNLKKFVETL